MGFLFTIFYQPIANLLLYPLAAFETNSIVFGIVILVLITKIALIQMSIKNTKVQIRMQSITEDLKKIREKIKDRKEQAEETMKIYKKTGINPFTPLLLIIIQIPISLSIFFVVRDIGKSAFSFSETLYPFIQQPSHLDLSFLTMNFAETGNIIVAFLVGITQILLMWYTQKHIVDKSKKGQKIIFTIVFPVIATVASFSFSAIIGVYWLINNLFSVLQEILVINHIRKKEMENIE